MLPGVLHSESVHDTMHPVYYTGSRRLTTLIWSGLYCNYRTYIILYIYIYIYIHAYYIWYIMRYTSVYYIIHHTPLIYREKNNRL